MVSITFEKVKQLASSNDILISNHGYDELIEDDIIFRDILMSIQEGIVIEDYPNYHKGPCALVLQTDKNNKPVHVVWGIPKGKTGPAVLITAYRPDPKKWSNDFLRRKK